MGLGNWKWGSQTLTGNKTEKGTLMYEISLPVTYLVCRLGHENDLPFTKTSENCFPERLSDLMDVTQQIVHRAKIRHQASVTPRSFTVHQNEDLGASLQLHRYQSLHDLGHCTPSDMGHSRSLAWLETIHQQNGDSLPAETTSSLCICIKQEKKICLLKNYLSNISFPEFVHPTNIYWFLITCQVLLQKPRTHCLCTCREDKNEQGWGSLETVRTMWTVKAIEHGGGRASQS